MAEDKALLHGGKRDLSNISLYALLLGFVQGTSFIIGAYLFHDASYLWRLSFFIFTLSTFHFLEFYTTSRYNTQNAQLSSYLLFGSNGRAWNIAHSCAMVEIVVDCLLLRDYGPSARWSPITVCLGFGLVVLGQIVRSMAMIQAGSNFNHIVAREKAAGHMLVTSGIYAHVRHPSYFGFFWWAIGTQIAVGNIFCGIVYALVLWRFFDSRIQHEEAALIEFFGDEYKLYRKATPTGLPLIK